MPARNGQDRPGQTATNLSSDLRRGDTLHLRSEMQYDRTPEERLGPLHSRGGSPDGTAARIGIKESLSAIDMLDEDMRHLKSTFLKPSERELREQCRDYVHEYEESMLVWKEMKDTGELCTSDTDSEAEDELTGEELLRALDKVSVTADPAKILRAKWKGIDWPQRVLRQTIFV